MTSSESFDQGVSEWLERLEQPWNRLRYIVYQANLNRHLPDRPLRILDAGGGNGSDAIRLAKQGHHVTLVDFSAEMLAEAQRYAAASGVADTVTLRRANIYELPGLFSNPEFDVVVSHNVLQYVDDLPAAVKAICAPLKQNGTLSVINVNRYSEVLQAALLRLDLEEATAKLDADEVYSPVWKIHLRCYTAEELVEPLRAAGCEIVGRYGVRCVTDYIYDNAVKYNPEFYAQLEQLEVELSGQYPYYLIARFFQLIARKT